MNKIIPTFSPDNIKSSQIDYIIDIMLSTTLSEQAYAILTAEVQDTEIKELLFNSVSLSFPNSYCTEVLREYPELLDSIQNSAVTSLDKIKVDIFVTCYTHKYGLIGELYYNIINYANLNYKNPLNVASNSISSSLLGLDSLLNNNEFSFESIKRHLLTNYAPNLQEHIRLNLNRFLEIQLGEFKINLALSDAPMPDGFWEQRPLQKQFYKKSQQDVFNDGFDPADIVIRLILNQANSELIGYVIYICDDTRIPKIYDIFIIEEYRGIRISSMVLASIADQFEGSSLSLVPKNSYTLHNSITESEEIRLVTADFLRGGLHNEAKNPFFWGGM